MTPTRIALLTALLAPALAVAPALARPVESPAALLAHTGFDHGLPYARAHALGPQAVPTLVAMLADPAEKPHWRNIITILGMIGDARAEAPLTDFLERRVTDAAVDPATYQALLQVPIALGFLAHNPQSSAFAWLWAGSSVATWRQKPIRWSHPLLRPGEREILLSQLSINGLGIAGNAAAREHLEKLKLTMSEDGAMKPYLEANVNEAIQLNARIEKEGFERVFTGDTGK